MLTLRAGALRDKALRSDPDLQRVISLYAMTTAAATLRTATADDAQRIHELHLAAVRALCCNHYTPTVLDGWLANRSACGYLRGISTGAVVVAELGQHVIGFSEGVPGEVVAVFVDPAFANRGVGSLLFERALSLAEVGQQSVRLESTLNAVPFYERFGFVQVERSTVRRNQVEIPIVVMRRAAR